MRAQAIEATQQAAATKSHIAVSATVTTGAMGASGFVEQHYQLIMMGIALAGFVVTFYYAWRNFSLNKRRTELAEEHVKTELRNQIIAEINGDLPETTKNKILNISERRKA